MMSKKDVGRGPMQAGFGGIMPPVLQADATLSQANPVSGTQYTLLDTKSNCRLIAMGAQCTWTVQPDPLELHLVIDGVTRTFAVGNPVSVTRYGAIFSDVYGDILSGSALADYRAFLTEGRSIAITAEITGGTVSSLDAAAIYALY